MDLSRVKRKKSPEGDGSRQRGKDYRESAGTFGEREEGGGKALQGEESPRSGNSKQQGGNQRRNRLKYASEERRGRGSQVQTTYLPSSNGNG